MYDDYILFIKSHWKNFVCHLCDGLCSLLFLKVPDQWKGIFYSIHLDLSVFSKAFSQSFQTFILLKVNFQMKRRPLFFCGVLHGNESVCTDNGINNAEQDDPNLWENFWEF